MNCPNCNEPLEPVRETRTTTGVSARFACPCGLAFNAYRAAYATEWTVSLQLSQAQQPKRWPVNLSRARRALVAMALEDVQLLGRLGVETEQARQLVIKAKENNDGERQTAGDTKTNRKPGDKQRQWAGAGLNRKPGRRPGSGPGTGRANGVGRNGQH